MNSLRTIYNVCPHCQQEIFEKHSYQENGVDFHSDCHNPIEWPPMSAEDRAWLDNFFKK